MLAAFRAQKRLIVMVGLPARGKTYVARKLARYFTWRGLRVRHVNAGEYRRALLGAKHSHEFFSPDNTEGKAARLSVAQAALDDLFAWLRGEGDLAIYDATNTSRARRELILARAEREGARPLFVEIVCEDAAVIEANIRETKVLSPDYAGVAPEEVVRDFLARIEHYERAYEPLATEAFHYVKYIDKGQRLVIHGCEDDLEQELVRFLLHLRGARRTTWLTRHGESVYNGLGLIGGDPDLSAAGIEFARRLARFVDDQGERVRDLVVWTSTLKRTLQTARELHRPFRAFRELEEINAGICEGKSYADIERELPEEFAARRRDKFRYRYPRGESYADVIDRLVPVVLCFERESRPLLVVGHQAVLRAFYAYMRALPPEQCPFTSIPLHTVIELTPRVYEMDEQRFALLPGG